MAPVNFTVNDGILFFAFFFSASDIFSQWPAYSTCYRPIHLWLVISYLSVVLFRCSHFLGQYLSDDPAGFYDDPDDFLIYSNPRGPPKWLTGISLGLLFPFFVIWTIIGSVWFRQVVDFTPTCLPDESHPWFILFWLVLSYLWIGLYLLFLGILAVVEQRARQAERSLQLIESEDLIQRWGQLRGLATYGLPLVRRGIPAEKLAKLPYHQIRSKAEATELLSAHGPCAICLDDFDKNEDIRVVQPCHHIFHRSCIDIWLLRNASCPNCKGAVFTRCQPSRADSLRLSRRESHRPGDANATHHQDASEGRGNFDDLAEVACRNSLLRGRLADHQSDGAMSPDSEPLVADIENHDEVVSLANPISMLREERRLEEVRDRLLIGNAGEEV